MNAADRELYAETKRQLAARNKLTIRHHAGAKTEVIETILVRAVAAQYDGGVRTPADTS